MRRTPHGNWEGVVGVVVVGVVVDVVVVVVDVDVPPVGDGVQERGVRLASILSLC